MYDKKDTNLSLFVSISHSFNLMWLVITQFSYSSMVQQGHGTCMESNKLSDNCIVDLK